MIRKLLIFLMLTVLIVPMTAFAAERTGSIRLTMHHGSDAVPGGTVTLYCITGWEDMTDPQKLAASAADAGLPGTTRQVGTDGRIVYEDLEPGQYLLVQKAAAEGYLSMKPFCVSLPMSVGGELIYHIDASPKLELVPSEKLPQTGLLVWPAWVLLGAGAMLIGIGIFSEKQK